MKSNRVRCPNRALLLLAFVTLAAASSASAQVGDSYRGHGYVFVAPVGFTNSYTEHLSVLFGGGGERLVYKGLGVGAELGVSPMATIGIFSANGSYHFVNRATPRKLVPFVTAGYSFAWFTEVAVNFVNLGGGMNYWFHERAAVRLEFRDHSIIIDPIHLWAFRFGLSFR